MLETVYEAIENAGLTLHGHKGSQVSAYVGAMSADTHTRNIENISQYTIIGMSRARRIGQGWEEIGPRGKGNLRNGLETVLLSTHDMMPSPSA